MTRKIIPRSLLPQQQILRQHRAYQPTI